MQLRSCLVLSLLSLACQTTTEPVDPADDVVIEFADHADTLSDDADDGLFVFELKEAEDTYALEDVEIWLNEPGDTPTSVNFELTRDANGDGQLGSGDQITAIEPLDSMGKDLIGTKYQVELMAADDEDVYWPLWRGTWTAR
jgi:hypothetical protein